jgi:hypothetical protein
MNPKPTRRPAVRPQVISGAQLARRRDAVQVLAEAGGDRTLVMPPASIRPVLADLAGAGLVMVCAGKVKLTDSARSWYAQLARGGDRGPLMTTEQRPLKVRS